MKTLAFSEIQDLVYDLSNDEKLDLVDFIINSMRNPKKKSKRDDDIKEEKRIDNLLYGCIKLPDDFDYDKELEMAYVLDNLSIENCKRPNTTPFDELNPDIKALVGILPDNLPKCDLNGDSSRLQIFY